MADEKKATEYDKNRKDHDEEKDRTTGQPKTPGTNPGQTGKQTGNMDK